MLNILILEDNPIFHQRLSRFLREWEQVNDICVKTNFSAFLEIPDFAKYDIFLVDLSLPDGDGLEAIKLFKKHAPEGLIIVVSARVDSSSILESIKFGAVGYLHKDDGALKIISSLKEALNGGSPITPMIASKIFSNIRSVGVSQEKSIQNTKIHKILTVRETEVINLIAKGLTYKEVASSLKLSVNTVPVHVRNIYKKLQTTNRSEAVFEARALGILQ